MKGIVLSLSVVVLSAGVAQGAVGYNLSLKDWTGTSQTNRPAQSAFLTDAGLKAAFVWADGDSAWEGIKFDSVGATFGYNNAGYEGRNSLLTLSSDYASTSFTAYVTVTTSTNFEAWLGMGGGGVVSWNGPSNTTNDAVYMAIRNGQNPWDPVGNIAQSYGAYKVVQPANSDNATWGAWNMTDPMRLKMEFDMAAQTATFSFDVGYDGNFAADYTIAPMSTAGMFAGRDSSIFFGSRSSSVMTDFLVVVPEPASLSLLGLAGGTLLLARKRQA